MTKQTRLTNNPYYDHNSNLYKCDCHITDNIWEHDRHILWEHGHDSNLVERVVGYELWEHWKNKYFREEI